MKNDIFLHSQNMKIHEKIRTIRQTKGLTQDYLADKIGIDTVNYGRIERGQAKLTVDRFLEISEILEVAPNLFFETNTKPEGDDIIGLLNKIFETEVQILKQMKNEECKS